MESTVQLDRDMALKSCRLKGSMEGLDQEESVWISCRLKDSKVSVVQDPVVRSCRWKENTVEGWEGMVCLSYR
jgi:hypothetical protein